jgi:hypothetical protein
MVTDKQTFGRFFGNLSIVFEQIFVRIALEKVELFVELISLSGDVGGGIWALS